MERQTNDLLPVMKPEAELNEFLRKPNNDADDAEPPTLPPHLGNLPHTTYVTAALEYLDDYPFDRRFITPTGWAVDSIALPNLGGEGEVLSQSVCRGRPKQPRIFRSNL